MSSRDRNRRKKNKKQEGYADIDLVALEEKVEAMQQMAFLQGSVHTLIMLRNGQLPLDLLDAMISDLQQGILLIGPRTGVPFSVPGFEPSEESDDVISMEENESAGEQGTVEDDLGKGGPSNA